MDDKTEYQELLKAEAQEKRDTDRVFKLVGLIMLFLALCIALTSCDTPRFPFLYVPDMTHLA